MTSGEIASEHDRQILWGMSDAAQRHKSCISATRQQTPVPAVDRVGRAPVAPGRRAGHWHIVRWRSPRWRAVVRNACWKRARSWCCVWDMASTVERETGQKRGLWPLLAVLCARAARPEHRRVRIGRNRWQTSRPRFVDGGEVFEAGVRRCAGEPLCGAHPVGAGDEATPAAVRNDGLGYVVDVDLPGAELSLVVPESNWVAGFDASLDRVSVG